MWLTGAAGGGKTAITQSMVELSLQNDLAIANFFFGRSDKTRNHGGALIATLVYQIYHSVPSVAPKILSVIDADPLIFHKSLEHQCIELLAKPLHAVLSHSRGALDSGSHHVIVIDGLDECFVSGERQRILWLISSMIQEFDLPILFFISSRPEYDISTVFRSQEMNGLYTHLHLDERYRPDEDIRKFLRESFQDIRNTHPFKFVLPEVWPTSETIEFLVKKSSGQFAYAADVIRYAQSSRHQPHHRLQIAMKLRPSQKDLPFIRLDALYRTLLSSVEDVDNVLYVLSIYALGLDKHRDLDIKLFLSLKSGELEILFHNLVSLVTVEPMKHGDKEKKTLKFLHASFFDFLLDPPRSKEYYIDINFYRPKHIANILHYLTICELLPSRYFLFSNFAIADNKNNQSESIRDFWMKHILLCQNTPELIQRACVFPLAEVAEPLKGHGCDMGVDILFGFFAFLRRMVTFCPSCEQTSIFNFDLCRHASRMVNPGC